MTGPASAMAQPALRVATADDQESIDALMKASTRALFPAWYSAQQTESSVIHIAHVDPTLIEDGTYFVIDGVDGIVACGGWSRRDKLFSGSIDQEGRARPLDPASEPARVRAMFVRGDWTRRGLGTRILEACEAAAREAGFVELTLMATLPGVPLYARFGFREVSRAPISLPDGVLLEGVAMEKEIGPARQKPTARP
ncbi:MAG: GNAT family N-acetyltransferase [Chloroflexota bacterium]